MVSKELISKLKRMGPVIKKMAGPTYNSDETECIANPVPFSWLDIRDEIAGGLTVFVCSEKSAQQIVAILEQTPFAQAHEIDIEHYGKWLCVKLFRPNVEYVVVAIGEELNCEYWVLHLKTSCSMDIINLQKEIVGKPTHQIGVTSDW